MNPEKVTQKLSEFSSSAASLLKVALMSGRPFPAVKTGDKKSIAILGNGPSLRETLDKEIDVLLVHDLMCVNFAANTPDFMNLRPSYYILADAHFFKGIEADENVKKLWQNFESLTWEMTLFVPVKFRHLAEALVFNSPNVKLFYFNLTPVEGLKPISRLLYDLGLGMPRPRNVMIPAIFCAIRMGYEKIYLCGADHTWTRTLSVDENNRVVSIQPHFYKDNENENLRVRETYKDLRLHQVLGSMTTAFKSYWDIADYAQKKGVEIINSTPGSMIDAFKRGSI